MNVSLGLAPWSMLLDITEETVLPRDETKLAVTIDAGICAIVELDTIRARWGETAASVIVTALRTGLGRVINVWDPDDIEWVADWWKDRLEMYADPEDEDERQERAFEEERIRDFDASQKLVRSSYLQYASRTMLSEALKAVPAGPVRRGAAALLSVKRQPRRLWPSAPWHRLRTTEDGYPTAAVLITRSQTDAARHAYDEMQEDSMNSGLSPPIHGVVLLDTSTPMRLAVGLQQLRRVLRTIAWGEHVVHAILELQDQ
jgi:hypothetical protein